MSKHKQGPSKATEADSGFRTFVGCRPGSDARWRGVPKPQVGRVQRLSQVRVHEAQLKAR